MTINTRTIMNVDNSNIGTVNRKSDTSAGDLFASIMNVSMAQKDDSLPNNGFASKDVESNQSKSSFENSTVEKDKIDSEFAINDKVERKSIDKETENETEEKESIDELDDEFGVNVIDPLILNLKQTIQEEYEISDEEFSDLLERVGVAIGQLADIAVVSDVIAELEDITKVDLLIDQELNNKLQETVEDIMIKAESFEAEEMEVESAINLDLQEDNIEDFEVDSDFHERNIGRSENVTEIVGNDSALDDADDTITASVNVDKEYDDSERDEGRLDSIENNLSNALDRVINNDAVEEVGFNENVSGADIVRQVVDEIKVSSAREVSSIEVNLNPENLGKVNITVESKNGVLQAKIVAETEAAEKAIAAGIENLKEAFNAQEIKVDAIEVMIAPHSFFEDGQADSFGDNREENTQADGGNGSVVGGLTKEDEGSNEDDMLKETVRSTVSYMA